MPTAASKLSTTQYGGLIFPGRMIDLSFIGRHHVHEYSHVPGGAVEKLGRGLVRVSIRTSFEDRFKAPYQNLYPAGLDTLRGYALNQATLPFTHPEAGTFPATIVNYSQKKEEKLLSGEKVELDFLEDQPATFALAATSSSVSSSVGPASDNLQSTAANLKAQLQFTPNDISLLSAIQGAANAILGLRDTANLVGNRYIAAVSQLLGLCQQLDQAVSMQDARAWPVVQALRDLQLQATQIFNDSQSQQLKLGTYVVPQPMSAMQIALNIYQDASRLGDILSLNSTVIPNALSIAAATKIRYYPPTAPQQARLAA
jgi:hypothetical protein